MDTRAIDDAYKRGDLAALIAALDDPPDFPNCRGHYAAGPIILEYAIYHSPLPFIRTLLQLGADPNYGDHAGFPSLIAALTRDGKDTCELLELLLSFGADVEQRGMNDYTPLHWAAIESRDTEAIKILLAHGAEPRARTRIDDYTTPLEEAERLGLSVIFQMLKRGGARPATKRSD